MTVTDHKPATLVLPPVPYAAALLGGWWLNRHVYAIPLDCGEATRVLGWLLMGIGLMLLVWTMITFWRHRTTVNPYRAASTLCTDGPFRFSRNPIYVGDWFVLAGASLLLTTAWPLLFSPLIWALLRYGVIRHEEEHLEVKFGEDYLRYKTRVRRWL
jgi:protein-S-isoprenylcysteine O-methyltransferase Ste14